MQISNPLLERRRGRQTFIMKRKKKKEISAPFKKNPMEENLYFSVPRSTCLGSIGLMEPRLSLSSCSQHTPRIHESRVIFQSRLRIQFTRAPWGLLGMTQKQVISLWKPKEDTEEAEQGQVALQRGTGTAASHCRQSSFQLHA